MKTAVRFAAFSLLLALGAAPAFAAITSSFAGNTLTVTSDGADAIVITCGGTVLVNGQAVAGSTCGGATSIIVNGGPGANAINLSAVQIVGGFAANTTTTINGNAGADVIVGSGFPDTINGGTEIDDVTGGLSADTINLGPGNDLLRYNIGDGSEQPDGGDGLDRFLFNGSAGTDAFVVLPNAGRAQVQRGSAIILTIAFEAIDLAAGGGADTFTVTPLTGTNVTSLVLRLGGDAVADAVTISGTNGTDGFLVQGNGADDVSVNPIIASSIFILDADPATGSTPSVDRLTVNGGAGDDTIGVDNVAAGRIDLVLSGGTEFDTLQLAAPENRAVSLTLDSLDILFRINGRTGRTNTFDLIDIINGPDDDTLSVGPGVEAAAFVSGRNRGGADRLRMTGTPGPDQLLIAPVGGDVRLTTGSGTVSLLDFAEISYEALGGADSVELQDLGALPITRVFVDFEVLDGANDVMTYSAGTGDDAFRVTPFLNGAGVDSGNLSMVVVTAEPLTDRLLVLGGEGSDLISTSILGGASIDLVIDGGNEASGRGDQVRIFGDDSADRWAVRAITAQQTRIERTAPTDASIDLFDAEEIHLDTLGGIDSVSTPMLANSRLVLLGGEPSTQPGDTLDITNFGGLDGVSPVFRLGFAPVVHSGFEFAGLGQRFEAFLDGGSEVPPNESPAKGYGAVTLTSDGTAYFAAFEFAGLAANNTVSALHGPAPRGAVASPFFDFPTDAATNGQIVVGPIPLTTQQLADLRRGLWYFNVSSTLFPSGEIRGQVDDATFKDGFE